MKKVFILAGIILLSVFLKIDTVAEASTSASMQEILDNYYNYSKYADNYDAPFSKANNDNVYVDEFTGTLNLRETDLSIPGKNGMDVNITRMYNNQNNGYKLVSKNSSTVFRGYIYSFVINGVTKYIPIYFEGEEYGANGTENIPASFTACNLQRISASSPGDISGNTSINPVSYDMIKRTVGSGTYTYTKYSSSPITFTVRNTFSYSDMGEKK